MNRIIRTNGESEPIPYPPKVGYICEKLGNVMLDSITLHHLGLPTQVMYVADEAGDRNLPVNEEATKLYLANCKAGTTNQILGDVAVVFENDLTD